jgi:hypothetical protein
MNGLGELTLAKKKVCAAKDYPNERERKQNPSRKPKTGLYLLPDCPFVSYVHTANCTALSSKLCSRMTSADS